MSDTKPIHDRTRVEPAILVGLSLPGEEPTGTRYDPLAELAALAKGAGAEVVGRIIQRRNRVCAATYIGPGKVEELAACVEEKQAHIVIFDNELSPPQIRELEARLNAARPQSAPYRRVLDRTELILDIFASRAQTYAARLQVELAQLQYTAPRLRGMWTHLERIAGAGGGTSAGVVGGIGTRGPGERQIEIDRRIVQRRVALLRRKIAEIDRRKLREVRSRRDYFAVALAGYTNAGKSTLLNALTGADALVADKLFATLDTKTRRWDLGDSQSVLLSDTVGFIRKLPHHLVASFRATLEEVIHSDLLLHVIDASSPDAEGQVEAVDRVLAELGCGDIPVVAVLNKVDAVTDDSALRLLRSRWPEAVEISALRRQGLDALTQRVVRHVQGRYVQVIVDSDTGNGRLLAYVRQHGQILQQDFRDDRVRLEVRLPAAEVQRVVGMGGVLVEC